MSAVTRRATDAGPCRRDRLRRRAIPLVAAGLVAGVLPFTAGGAQAVPVQREDGGDAATGPAFGYSTSAWAAPFQLQIYEPTIPFPNSPQLELEAGYTEVLADSASTRGRASMLWPGSAIGEGFKTIIEQFGLPAQLGEDGYPVQVNSGYPTGETDQTQEPLPGLIQRAKSKQGFSSATAGFSLDSVENDPDGPDSGGLLPGLPGIPGLSGSNSGGGVGGLLGPLGDLLGLGGGGKAPRVSAKDAADTADTAPEQKAPGMPSIPGLPPALSVLVDVGGFTSKSVTDNTKKNATATSRAHAGDISLLGGLITIAGLTTRSGVSSDGKAATTDAKTHYGVLKALGQKFAFGPDGFEAVGNTIPIPGLPDTAVKALQVLGVTISVPKPQIEKDGDAATIKTAALTVDLDLTALKSKLPTLPLADLLNFLPDQLGTLKSLLGAVTNLSPRIVISLAVSGASVDTSPPIEFPPLDIPTDTPTDTPTTDTPTSDAPSDNGGPSAAVPPGSDTSVPTDTAPPGDTGGQGDGLLLPTAAPTEPGLPALFSIPGMMILGALVLAAMGGTLMRRIGLLALGAGPACSHGLDSGLPDLRKVE